MYEYVPDITPNDVYKAQIGTLEGLRSSNRQIVLIACIWILEDGRRRIRRRTMLSQLSPLPSLYDMIRAMLPYCFHLLSAPVSAFILELSQARRSIVSVFCYALLLELAYVQMIAFFLRSRSYGTSLPSAHSIARAVSGHPPYSMAAVMEMKVGV